MSEHTKEPWYFDQKNTCISPVSDDQLEICSIQPIDTTAKAGKWFMFGEQSEANARRIVACVNACEGITNEQLEICSKNGVLQGMDERISSLEAQLACAEYERNKYATELMGLEAQLKDRDEKINFLRLALDINNYRIGELEAQLEKLSGKTGYCEQCERLGRENKELREALVNVMAEYENGGDYLLAFNAARKLLALSGG